MPAAPWTQRRKSIAVVFCELRAPVGDDAFIDQGLQERLEALIARREELRAMVELEPSRIAGRHASAGAARLLEDGDFGALVQTPCDNETREAGADDGDPGHCGGLAHVSFCFGMVGNHCVTIECGYTRTLIKE